MHLLKKNDFQFWEFSEIDSRVPFDINIYAACDLAPNKWQAIK